ncbi:MAG: SDR family oxidoreductase [Defluviitaleaceae bacterium]|nr:SDR family oxidoreductase [Defluviitaleaceae bacterium]
MDLFSLHGKTAIVTGGNKGLGGGITEGLAMAGAKVAIIASSDSVFSAAEDFRAKGYDVTGYKSDLSHEDSIKETFDNIVSEFGGRLDILVNNAGIVRRVVAEDSTLKDWDDVINLNLRTVFIMSQLAGRIMIRQGRGKIINTASMTSWFGSVKIPSYAASKGGVAQLTKALANEWASKGVNVNAFAPGYMATEMTASIANDTDNLNVINNRIPAKRWGKPEDLRGLIIFLASEASDYVNGAVIPIDGGYLAR